MSGERWALPRWRSVCGLMSAAGEHWAHVGSNGKAFLGEPAMLPDEPWQTEVAPPSETESRSVLLGSSKWKNLHGPETSLFWKVTFCFLKCAWARFLDCPFSFLFIPSLTHPKIFFWAHTTYQALGYNWDRHTKVLFCFVFLIRFLAKMLVGLSRYISQDWNGSDRYLKSGGKTSSFSNSHYTSTVMAL